MAASSSPPDSSSRSRVSESLFETVSIAPRKRSSSASTSPSVMLSRSGLSSPATWTKAGPTTAPSEAPMPASFTGLLVSFSLTRDILSLRLRRLVLVFRDELDQGLHGLFRIVSLGPDHYLVALFSASRRALGRDLRVGLALAF